MDNFTSPIIPLDHTLSLTRALHFNAHRNPELPCWVFSAPNRDGKLTSITHLQLYDASHRAARALFPKHGAQTWRSNEVVGVLALSDSIVYHAVTAACVVAGVVPLLIFPRISPEGILGLLKATKCHKLVATQATLSELIQQVKMLDQSWELNVVEMPSLQDIYQSFDKSFTSDLAPALDLSATLEPSPDDVYFYLHSSGSTGLPKAIPIAFKVFQTWMNSQNLHDAEQASPRYILSVVVLPNGHFSSWYAAFMQCVYSHVTAVVFPPLVTQKDMLPMAPTSTNVIDHSRKGGSNSILTVPAFLHVWAEDPETVKYLAGLERVSFAGGPTSHEIGDRLAQGGVKLHCRYGATEIGSINRAIRSDESDWRYVAFNENVKIHWEPQGDGTFELQLLNTQYYRSAVQNLSDPLRYATSDRWEKHPTKDLWHIVGRIDDVIIHSSGEKTVPAPMENFIISSPLISAAVMFGRQRDQPGIIIEAQDSSVIYTKDLLTRGEFVEQIWPVIERANSAAPAFSYIFKETILIATRPLPRTSKGTIQRKAALKEYESEIEAMYESIAQASDIGSLVLPESLSFKDIQEWLLLQAQELISGRELVPTDDLFHQGFDSLKATILRRRIAVALKSFNDERIRTSASQLLQNIVYEHPAVSSLAQFIATLTLVDGTGKSSTPLEDLEAMIAKYSERFPVFLDTAEKTNSGSQVVLVTGTTGALGAYLLEGLLNRPDVAKVYAFNRPGALGKTLHERQQASFEDRGLSPELLYSSKLVLLTGDLTGPDFSLDPKMLSELSSSITMVIHNAWRLDFNLSLASFEPQIRGTRNLIDFALTSRHASSLRFLFASSVASASGWDRRLGPFPEDVQFDPSLALGTGYGQSKYVIERILSISGLAGTSIRMGQLCGGEPVGFWSTTDWVPILTRSSVAMGHFPSSLGHLSWLPLNCAAQSILEIGFHPGPLSPAFNLLHPDPVSWNTVAEALIASLRTHDIPLDGDLQLLPFPDWIASLRTMAINPTADDLHRNPALKILPFLETLASAETILEGTAFETGGLAPFSLEKAMAASGSLRAVPQINARLVDGWVSYWKSRGLFPLGTRSK